MLKNNGKERYLPSREVSYAYTVAMHFAQQIELDLKAILYAADYHGWGSEIMSDKQLKKFKKNSDKFIDDATYGRLITALKRTGIIKNGQKAWTAFEVAHQHRNKLAHSFLAEQNFNGMTKQREMGIVGHLQEITIDLHQALLISRSIRQQAECVADETHEVVRRLFVEPTDYENPNRHYATRKRKKNGEGGVWSD
jgi:hypothetical protein